MDGRDFIKEWDCVFGQKTSKIHRKENESILQILQIPSEENETDYKMKWNNAKAFTREAHQQLWERFVSNVEHDLHGQLEVAYKSSSV